MRLVDCFIELLTYTSYFLLMPKAGRPSYDEVRKQYELLFARSRECVKKGGFTDEQEESALFAVCAWIDESILCSDWPEREKWARAPLQLLRFGTTRAGEEFFRLLDKLEKEDTNVREVYGYCLALGFRGRYFLDEDENILNEIRSANLNLITEAAEPRITEKIFPDAYCASRKEGKGWKWFRLISPAKIPLIVMPVAFFVALYFLYKYMLGKTVSSFLGSF